MFRMARRPAVGLSAAVVGAAAMWMPLEAGDKRRGDAETALPVAAHGTRFHFEIIETCDARYLGDTPAHAGKARGL